MSNEKIRLHVGCGTVYLDGYVNIDVPKYSRLASCAPDESVDANRTTVDRYYKAEETQETLEAPRAFKPVLVDVYGDVDALPYLPESVDEIRSVQVLEHVELHNVSRVLTYWRSLLKPGGLVHVDVPDFEETVRQLIDQTDEKAKDWYYRLVYGSQKNEFRFHKSGFSPARLERLLHEAGFREVRHLANGAPGCAKHFYPVCICEAIK